MQREYPALDWPCWEMDEEPIIMTENAPLPVKGRLSNGEPTGEHYRANVKAWMSALMPPPLPPVEE